MTFNPKTIAILAAAVIAGMYLGQIKAVRDRLGVK